MKLLLTLTLLFIFPCFTWAVPIFGASFEINGSFSGNASSILGAHDDQFIQIDSGTSVTVSFAEGSSALADGTNAFDLRVHTFDEPAPVNGEIFISADGTNFISLGIFSDANPPNHVLDFDLDILGFTHVVAVRIIDVSGTADGFDLDAIEGFEGGLTPNPVPEPSSLVSLLFGIGLCFVWKTKK